MKNGISEKKITLQSSRKRLAKNEPLAGSNNPAHLYPSESAIANRIAELHGITTKNILLTSGGDNGLDIIIRSISKDGGKAILLNPDFIRYGDWVKSSDLEIVSIDLEGFNPELPEKEIFSVCDNDVKILIVSTVGNPSGYVLSRGFIERFHQKFPDVLILIDEVYSNFTGDDYSRLAAVEKNIVSLRSLSKLGAPGLRVGYIIATEDTIQTMRRFGLAHPIAGPCQAEAMRILNTSKPLDKLVKEQIVAREWLVTELRKLGLHVEDSPANWLHIYLGVAAEKVFNLLKENGIDVFMSRHPKMRGWLRITTPNLELVRFFADELIKYFSPPFIESEGLLQFTDSGLELNNVMNYPFLSLSYGEVVSIDHFNVIFSSVIELKNYLQGLTDDGAEIIEGLGIYPKDFCTHFDDFPENLSMYFASVRLPNGIVVLAAPIKDGDQLSGFIAARGSNAVHHIAIIVEDIDKQVSYWLNKGFAKKCEVIGDNDLKQIFLENNAGQIVELIQRLNPGGKTFTCDNIQKLRKSE